MIAPEGFVVHAISEDGTRQQMPGTLWHASFPQRNRSTSWPLCSDMP